MPHHNATIKITSGGKIEQLTLSPEAVEELFPGTPQESADEIRDSIHQLLRTRTGVNSASILKTWMDENITVQS